jgi:hypothetical protein
LHWLTPTLSQRCFGVLSRPPGRFALGGQGKEAAVDCLSCTAIIGVTSEQLARVQDAVERDSATENPRIWSATRQAMGRLFRDGIFLFAVRSAPRRNRAGHGAGCENRRGRENARSPVLWCWSGSGRRVVKRSVIICHNFLSVSILRCACGAPVGALRTCDARRLRPVRPCIVSPRTCNRRPAAAHTL